MNTNNKEAIELLREAYNNMDIFSWESKCIKKALSLLQDNEDTEVEDIAVKEEYCHRCLSEKPSSKVEKLKELQEEIGGGGYGKDYIHPMCDLIDILLEDEE